VIHLGFECGSGQAIHIPVGHMVIVGQTTRAGKTTALEACATRSGSKCLAFLTKRGEDSFRMAREIPPYYEESYDWRTVRSLCEAVIDEKWGQSQRQALRLVIDDGHLGTVRSRVEWPAATSLEQLSENIETALNRASGKTQLSLVEIRSDLRALIRELMTLKTRSAVPQLEPGLNVVNLENEQKHVQTLIISSCIRWVRQYGENTVAVLPEAWKFAPGRRHTPVGEAAQHLVREGGALGNFVWIDSQTIGGLSSELLSQVRVWLFGVQRLRSEIDKTLDAIPDNLYPRPRPADIATLGKGEFIVCFDQDMFRCYCWPAWMRSALHAEAIARGEESVDSARAIVQEFDRERGEAKP
jgi:hypothetical protein